jgi:CBS domain-containing protein
MTVGAILAVKGRDVVTIAPAADLATAARMLSERKIGAVVVADTDHRVVGILSERDIVRGFATLRAVALEARVSDLMTREVATCKRSETISSVMKRMTAGKFRHLPVVEQGRLLGIVSIGDVVKHRLEQTEREATALRDYIQTA